MVVTRFRIAFRKCFVLLSDYSQSQCFRCCEECLLVNLKLNVDVVRVMTTLPTAPTSVCGSYDACNQIRRLTFTANPPIEMT